MQRRAERSRTGRRPQRSGRARGPGSGGRKQRERSWVHHGLGDATRLWGQACISCVKATHLWRTHAVSQDSRGVGVCSRSEWGLEPMSAPAAMHDTRFMLDSIDRWENEGGRSRVGRNERQLAEPCRCARPLLPGPRCPCVGVERRARRHRACVRPATGVVIRTHTGRDHASLRCCRTSTRKETTVSSPGPRRTRALLDGRRTGDPAAAVRRRRRRR